MKFQTNPSIMLSGTIVSYFSNTERMKDAENNNIHSAYSFGTLATTKAEF